MTSRHPGTIARSGARVPSGAALRHLAVLLLAATLGPSAAHAVDFVTETVDATPASGLYTSVAIDTAGTPWIAYFRAAEVGAGEVGEVRLTNKVGFLWPREVIDGQFLGSFGGYTSLALDAGGGRHIAYYGDGFGDLKYALRTTGPVLRENVDTAGRTGPQSAIALDAAGTPHVSYLDSTNLNLRYAVRAGGTWQTEIVDAAGFFGQSSSAIAIDGAGSPHVAYFARTTGRLRYAVKQGGNWSRTDVDALHATDPFVALAVDDSDTPRLAYVAGQVGNSQLKYAVRAGGGWTIESVGGDPNPDVGYFPSLAITSKGEPRISYFDFTNRDLRYASKSGGGWTTEAVDSGGDVGRSTSLALDADDMPRISYFDQTNFALKFADILRPLSIEVAPAGPASIPDGTTLQLLASATFTDSVARDVSDSAAWTSTDPLVATVGATGLVTAQAAGSATIRATLGRVSGQRNVTVSAATLTALEVTPSDTSAADGRTARFRAFGLFSDQSRVEQTTGITWTSTNTGIATVDATGLATAVSTGVAKIIARRTTPPALADTANFTVLSAALVTLTVSPENPSLRVGFTQQFSANGLFTDGGNVDLTSSVTWTSSRLTVATITGSGRATAVGEGSTVIRATSGAVSDSTNLIVTAARDSALIAMPAGTYRAISFPLFPDDPSIQAVLDELGTPDRKQWRFWRWSPRDSSYVEAGAGFTTVLPGEGYWLVTKSAANISAAGSPPPATDFVITLLDGPGSRPAWTFVANPFGETIFTSDILVTNGTLTVPLTDPANNLTERVVKGGDLPPFIDASSLQPRLGYWIKKIAPGLVQVVMPFPIGEKASGAVAHRAGAPPSIATGETPPRWTLRVTARQEDRVSETVEVGVAEIPAGSWSPLDRSLPPAPPGEFLRLASLESGWDRLSGPYTRTFRSPGEPSAWDLSLTGAAAPGMVTLVVDAADLPAGASVSIEDARGSRLRLAAEDLAAGERELTLAATGSAMPLHLRVIAPGSGEPASPALAPRFVNAYPNPFRDATGFRFRVDARAAISAGIYDASGRLVRTLSSRAEHPGEHVVVWDGRDASGEALPPGVYLARWQAGTAHGGSRVVLLR